MFLSLLEIFSLEVSIAVHVGSACPADGSFVGGLIDESEELCVDGVGFAEVSEDVGYFSVSEFEG